MTNAPQTISDQPDAPDAPGTSGTPAAPRKDRKPRESVEQGEGVDVDLVALAPSVEAVLFSLDKPTSLAKIAEAVARRAPGVQPRHVREAIDVLNEAYEQSGRAFRVEQVAGGFRVMTMPEHAEVVGAFHASRASGKLSRAAVETLAVIAYRQPVTRVQIEGIRGVACGEVLRTLLDKRLIAIVGRAEELGRPMLYGTTRHFLELFGLASVKDLPAVGDIAPDFATLIEPTPLESPESSEHPDATGDDTSNPTNE